MTETQEFLINHVPRTTRKIEYECKKCGTRVVFHRDIFKKEQKILEQKQIDSKLCQDCFLKQVKEKLNDI